MVKISVQQQEKTNVPAQPGKLEAIWGKRLLPLPFRSIQALEELDDARPH